jgi:hypothetical protein
MEGLTPMDAQPAVGTWYENDEGDFFVVVAVNADKGTIEIGTLDGAIDEIDMEAWSGMALQEIEPPDDWFGSMDDFLAARRGREPE